MNESISNEDVTAGQAVYSKRTLWIYDWLVLGFSNRFVWKCPTSRLLRMYHDNVTDNHLDVGVGTGYFLERCRFPSDRPRVALLDLNENCLQAAARRIHRYRPQCIRANVLEPIATEIAKFDSIAVNYVLHCLPGTMRTKATAIENLKRLLNSDGVLFGSTILNSGVRRGWLARRLMGLYNSKKIFTNTEDDLATLRETLSANFAEVYVTIEGCVAMFVARNET